MNITRCPRCRPGRAASVGAEIRCYVCGAGFEATVGVDIAEPFESLYTLRRNTVAYNPSTAPSFAELMAEVEEFQRRVAKALRVPPEMLQNEGSSSSGAALAAHHAAEERRYAKMVSSVGKYWVLPPPNASSLYGWHREPT